MYYEREPALFGTREASKLSARHSTQRKTLGVRVCNEHHWRSNTQSTLRL